jgi:hypothetical protein
MTKEAPNPNDELLTRPTGLGIVSGLGPEWADFDFRALSFLRHSTFGL